MCAPTTQPVLIQLTLNGKTSSTLSRPRNSSAVSTVPTKDSPPVTLTVMLTQSASSRSTPMTSFSSNHLQRTLVSMESVLAVSQLSAALKKRQRSLNPASSRSQDQSTLTHPFMEPELLTLSWETPNSQQCGTKTSKICRAA